ncbi:hypothetical protein ONS95_009867 [Cadophora gregata]|uniref:uncharacterized protein n=1 Tax=Cadophora gregata TaxID=51156 RepID=UPI0026DB22EF|nr:uncharacterized protein ONS95_009867 [Cadophora gregata]KAK0121577.1 hypothetical protein ONS95_009867 [Cadophora gregata]KAK0127053.1 hypothetical protein ONS96_006612 [Cadophora gregata f. sp. sojae]
MVMIEAREVSQDDELREKTADIDARSLDSMRRADDLAPGDVWDEGDAEVKYRQAGRVNVDGHCEV